MYPPLYEKAQKLLSTNWQFTSYPPKKRKELCAIKGKIRAIDALVKDVGLKNVLLMPHQVVMIEKAYWEIVENKKVKRGKRK